MNDKIRVKYDGRYLQAYMPNGDVIPQQTEITIENKVGDKDVAYATIQCVVDISELKEADKKEVDFKGSIEDLNAQLEKVTEKYYHAHKGFEYLKVELDKEVNKKWYQKLFGI